MFHSVISRNNTQEGRGGVASSLSRTTTPQQRAELLAYAKSHTTSEVRVCGCPPAGGLGYYKLSLPRPCGATPAVIPPPPPPTRQVKEVETRIASGMDFAAASASVATQAAPHTHKTEAKGTPLPPMPPSAAPATAPATAPSSG